MTMMRIATTRSQTMQALGLGGQNVIDAAGSIRAVLMRALGPAHAALFAEPEPDPGRGEIDWYAETQGPVKNLDDLPAPERAAARRELDRLTTEISALSEKLSASAEANERRIGEILLLALNIPEPGCIKVTGAQPVLVGWGHRPVAASTGLVAVRGLIKTETAPEPMTIFPAPEAAVAVLRPVGRKGFAWPLLFAAFVLLLPALYLLNLDLAALGAARICRIGAGDAAGVARFRQAEAEGATLDARLAKLTGQLADARHNCSASTAAPPAGTPPIMAPPDGGA